MLLVGLMVASLAGIIAILVHEHSRPHSSAVNAITTTQPATPDEPVTKAAPITTITAASPSSPLTNPSTDEGRAAAGKPASFWQLMVAYPTYCTPGTVVAPVLSWNAADTDTVAVSVDSPNTVGGYGFFDSIGSLTMPSVACIGIKGDPLLVHIYQIDAFGTDHTRLHVALTVDITVSAAEPLTTV
jgi:hypothetical protein